MVDNNNKLFRSIRDTLVGLPRSTKQFVVVGTDAVGIAVGAAFAAWLLFGSTVTSLQMSRAALFAVLIVLPFGWSQGLYRSVVRYMGLDLYVAALKTAIFGAIASAAALYFSGTISAPYRWAAAFWGMAFIYICSSRFLARMILVHRKARVERERIIIYGAGDAGAQLAINLLGGDQFLPVAMVDDDPALHGRLVKGLVVSPPSAIDRLIRDTNATRVLLAIPTASRRRRREVLELISRSPVYVQTMPDIADLVSGKARFDDLTDVDVDDLLGRDSVPPNPELLDACIKGKTVLVTGAGGSIGSELCHQILQQEPARLVLFEISEPALYNVERTVYKLREKKGIDCKIVALLGSVHHEERIRQVMYSFRVDTVYHAAAYKHVPIVEHNFFEGIHNNVFGTLHAARAAIDAGVHTFVLISTDKAVNPTSVMGATKRFAELILQAYTQTDISTRFCMVRFGNVLGSSGSVVPLFREQIRAGGPVTVTHREIIRYFMTIPEAAQLVIQAGSMAKGGDVFVLDMGEPVRIQDLAIRMVNLMGLTVRTDDNPDGDIEIKYTGLRPAEKLYEELLIGANVTGTRHPRIMRADEDSLSFDALSTLINELYAVSMDLDYNTARSVLLSAIKEYAPTNGIDDLVWQKKTGTDGSGDGDVVIDFPGGHH